MAAYSKGVSAGIGEDVEILHLADHQIEGDGELYEQIESIELGILEDLAHIAEKVHIVVLQNLPLLGGHARVGRLDDFPSYIVQDIRGRAGDRDLGNALGAVEPLDYRVNGRCSPRNP